MDSARRTLSRRVFTSPVLACAALKPCIAAAAPTPPLGHAGRWITGASDRVVIVHGTNLCTSCRRIVPRPLGMPSLPLPRTATVRRSITSVLACAHSDTVPAGRPCSDPANDLVSALTRGDVLRDLLRTHGEIDLGPPPDSWARLGWWQRRPALPLVQKSTKSRHSLPRSCRSGRRCISADRAMNRSALDDEEKPDRSCGRLPLLG